MQRTQLLRRLPGARPRSATGFSLVELMTVVTIVSILAAIAIPSYNSQVRKSRRTEARTAILDIATREERYFSVNNVYTSDASQIGYNSAGNVAFPNTPNGYYQIQVAVPDPAQAAGQPSFIVRLTAIGQQAPDTTCRTFTVDQLGRQASLDSGGADSTPTCWR